MGRKSKQEEVQTEDVVEIQVADGETLFVSEADIEELAENVFTYVGAGESPPTVINFMGAQEFVRGEPVLVTNEDLLKKIINNPSFVRGTVDMRALHDGDKQAAREAAEKRKRDTLIQQNFARKHSGGSDDE